MWKASFNVLGFDFIYHFDTYKECVEIIDKTLKECGWTKMTWWKIEVYTGGKWYLKRALRMG